MTNQEACGGASVPDGRANEAFNERIYVKPNVSSTAGSIVCGVINVYKEKGYTSFDVVAIMRGILKIRKIGHAGTLDPAAEGVLPILVGRQATKLCDRLMEKTKVYEAVMRLGVVTDTQDMTGEILATRDVNVDENAVTEALHAFEGGYDQLPPMYSAIWVDGKRLYDLARAGVEVERATRRVAIHDIKAVAFDLEHALVTIRVECGKGTYIRTICADIGERLGCGAAMQSLVRQRAGMFDVADSLTLAQVRERVVAGRLGEILMPVEEISGRI